VQTTNQREQIQGPEKRKGKEKEKKGKRRKEILAHKKKSLYLLLFVSFLAPYIGKKEKRRI
jgi:hypothetical protein